VINHFAVVALSSLALTLAVATAGSLFRPDDWYERLRKPAGTPPPWVFPVVWTILYILMALAAALVFISPAAPLRTAALVLYGVQLIANAKWSWLFFPTSQAVVGTHRPPGTIRLGPRCHRGFCDDQLHSGTASGSVWGMAVRGVVFELGHLLAQPKIR